MTNTELLNQAIINSGLRTSFICEKLGISRQAFSKKRNNFVQFKISEVLILKELLGLTNAQRDAIFFDKDVDDLSTN